jgi:hypothetical protein
MLISLSGTVTTASLFTTDSLPHLPAVDPNILISLKSEQHLVALDVENRDLENILQVAAVPDDD